MNTVTTIKPHIKTLTAPSYLRDLPGWLMWRYEQDGDRPDKLLKVPYYINGNRRSGVQGRPEDRKQLSTFDAAKAAAARAGFDGVGLALMPEFDITAIDFDDCVTAEGVRPDVENMVAGTYAEFSPSGEGVRAFVRGHLGDAKDFDGDYGLEVFSSKGFVTFTGQILPMTELLGTEDVVANPSADLAEVVRQRFAPKQDHDFDPLMDYAPPLGLSDRQIEEALDVLDPDLPRHHWLAIGMAIKHEKGDEGFDLWHDWSSRGSKYPGETKLRRQWDSLKKGETEGKLVTARTLVKMANDNGAHIRADMATEADIADAKADKPNRFAVVSAGAFSRGERPGWIMKGVIPRAELVVLFGESGSGKSFLALDMVAAIARGVEWRGHRTKPGRVVYIAAEGGGGFRNRLAAYQAKNNVDLDDYPFGIIHATPNFLEKADAVDVGRAILQAGRADVIVVDTFAQTTPGANENSAEDIGKALQHCRVIHKATGAVVILVHHAGKDPSKGARGWSGLRAAADAEIEVVKTQAGRMARVSKQKDGDDALSWGFDLEVVPIGIDEDGDQIDSCVVVEAEIPVIESAGSRKSLGKLERLVLTVFGEMSEAQSEGIEVKAVVDEVVNRLELPEGGRDTRRQRVMRTLNRLCNGDEAPFFLDGDCLAVV